MNNYPDFKSRYDTNNVNSPNTQVPVTPYEYYWKNTFNFTGYTNRSYYWKPVGVNALIIGGTLLILGSLWALFGAVYFLGQASDTLNNLPESAESNSFKNTLKFLTSTIYWFILLVPNLLNIPLIAATVRRIKDAGFSPITNIIPASTLILYIIATTFMIKSLTWTATAEDPYWEQKVQFGSYALMLFMISLITTTVLVAVPSKDPNRTQTLKPAKTVHRNLVQKPVFSPYKDYWMKTFIFNTKTDRKHYWKAVGITSVILVAGLATLGIILISRGGLANKTQPAEDLYPFVAAAILLFVATTLPLPAATLRRLNDSNTSKEHIWLLLGIPATYLSLLVVAVYAFSAADKVPYNINLTLIVGTLATLWLIITMERPTYQTPSNVTVSQPASKNTYRSVSSRMVSRSLHAKQTTPNQQPDTLLERYSMDQQHIHLPYRNITLK